MIGRLKKVGKSSALHLLYASGLLQLWLRMRLRRRAVVLTYHRVLDRESAAQTWSHPGIIVSSDTFLEHLRLLRKYFKVLSLAQFVEMLDSGSFDDASCLITFDDGWTDTYSVAWPALRRQGLPAVVFLPAAYTGSNRQFWQEELGRLVFESTERARTDVSVQQAVTPVLESLGLARILGTAPAKAREQVVELVRARKIETGTQAPAAIAAIRSMLPETASHPAVDAFMSWEQAREMASEGIAFGGHGTTHRILTALRDGEVAEEVGHSRQALEDHAVAQPPIAFSYPNGDYNTGVSRLVAESHFRLAFSTRPGHVGPGVDRYSLPRMNIHEGVGASAPMFLARVLGLI
jgi:peptidoglycan/xylan/chitin deacetylase (PgdA/CDA1 family)